MSDKTGIYMTEAELRHVAKLLDYLNQNIYGSVVSIGDFNILDSNGDVVGFVAFVDSDEAYAFVPGADAGEKR